MHGCKSARFWGIPMSKRNERLMASVLPAAAAILFLAIAPALSAQSNPRASAFLGVSTLGANSTFVAGTDVFQTHYNNGPKFGLRGTLDFSDHWGGEVMWAISGNNLRITSSTVPQPREFGVHVNQFSVNALYLATSRESWLRPFATAGLGFSHFGPTSDAQVQATQAFLNQPAVIQAETKPAFNFGAGVEAKPWTHFGLRADFRDYISGTPTYGLPTAAVAPGAPFFPASGAVNRIEVSGSFVLFLSGL